MTNASSLVQKGVRTGQTTADSPATRLAPSPTGLLHLGNVWSFLLCWLAAKAANGTVYLRMDDIDPVRSRADFASQIQRDLEWLGLGWDGPVVWQSKNEDLYREALQKLKDAGLAYPCFCTRRELRALASAPHIGDAGAPYPGTCSGLAEQEARARIAAGKPFAWRLKCPDEPVSFTDIIQGSQYYPKNAYGGDFALMRSDGVWAYQLANIVDDAYMGINLVARGRDLLPSAARQIVAGRMLGFAQPVYAHLPLLLDMRDERLAKRHQSLSVAHLKSMNISARRIIGALAGLAGLAPQGCETTPDELLSGFELARLPKTDLSVTGIDGPDSALFKT